MLDDITLLRERIRREADAAARLARMYLIGKTSPAGRVHKPDPSDPTRWVPEALMRAEMAARDAEIAALRDLVRQGQDEYRAARQALACVVAAARYLEAVR